MTPFTQDTIELVALDWLFKVGYVHIHGAVITPGKSAAERVSYADSLLAVLVETRDVLLPQLLSEEVRVGSST